MFKKIVKNPIFWVGVAILGLLLLWMNSMVIRAESVRLDFAAISMPANIEIAIEAQGSLIRTTDESLRVVFWKPDSTVSINGVRKFFICFGGGTVSVQANEWHVYYDCDTGRIAASLVAFMTSKR